MATLGLSFAVFALAVLGLAFGVLFGRAPIKGSCGGDNGCSRCSECPRRHREHAP